MELLNERDRRSLEPLAMLAAPRSLRSRAGCARCLRLSLHIMAGAPLPPHPRALRVPLRRAAAVLALTGCGMSRAHLSREVCAIPLTPIPALPPSPPPHTRGGFSRPSRAGCAPSPALVGRGLALVVPPSALASCFQYSLGGGGRAVFGFAFIGRPCVGVGFSASSRCPPLRRGRSSWPLPLSGSWARCAAAPAIRHAPIGALASLGTLVVASLPFFFGLRAVLRARLYGVSPLASLARFAPIKPSPNARRIVLLLAGAHAARTPLFP